MAIDRMKMADKHETRAVKLLGGRRTKASGSQWTDQGDGRNDHTEEPFAFAWDCKSTMAKSHTVTTEMLDKLEEQSQGERPAMPLRWYADETLKTYRDWVLVRLDDLAELIERSRELAAQPQLLLSSEVSWSEEDIKEFEHRFAVLEAELTGMSHRAKQAEDRAKDAETAAAAAAASVPQAPSAWQPSPVTPPQRNLSPMVPMLPWVSVFVTNMNGITRHNGVIYREDGHTEFMDVESVRVEPYFEGKRLFVNERIVRHGDLWVDGRLDTRVGAP